MVIVCVIGACREGGAEYTAAEATWMCQPTGTVSSKSAYTTRSKVSCKIMNCVVCSRSNVRVCVHMCLLLIRRLL